MKPGDLNFRHLLYFWAVAREGSITRAAQTLGLSVQAISTQLSQLESQLGHSLLVPRGRGLEPSDTGRLVLGYADQIFQLGSEMRDVLAHTSRPQRRLSVGLTDPIPKLVVAHMLEPVLRSGDEYRLHCVEGHLDDLVADLALNRLDLVLAHRPVTSTSSLKVYARPLGEWPMALYAAEPLRARFVPAFPARLAEAPMLLPMAENPLRMAIEDWFRRHRIAMTVRAECADSALLKTFARAGMGVLAAPTGLESELLSQYGLHPVGQLDGVTETFFAVTTERRIEHPGVQAILDAAEPGEVRGGQRRKARVR